MEEVLEMEAEEMTKYRRDASKKVMRRQRGYAEGKSEDDWADEKAIIKEGAKGDDIYLIAEGRVRVTKKAKDKRETLLGHLDKGRNSRHHREGKDQGNRSEKVGGHWDSHERKSGIK